jgi:gluconolactonase
MKPFARTYLTIFGLILCSFFLFNVRLAPYRVTRIATGFGFTEGPLCLADGRILFTDLLRNKIYLLQTNGDTSTFLDQAGGYSHHFTDIRWKGANGLATDPHNFIWVCRHGDRSVAVMDSINNLSNVITNWNNKRLNSPNDLVISSKNYLYFTDPPYGLDQLNNSPLKELRFNGVFGYHIPSKALYCLDSTIAMPNGIALSKNEKELLVTNSDPNNPVIYKYDLNEEGYAINRSIFYIYSRKKGILDGLKIDDKDRIYCTSPEGILCLSNKGKLLNIINLPEIPSNCNWNTNDYTKLYVTAQQSVYEILFLK